MMIETNSNYSFWAKKKGASITFNEIVNKAKSFTDDFDDATNKELNDMLDRGVEIISSEFQMQKYLQRFGYWHYNKLMHAFKNLSKSILNSDEIEIIDYGCGQGIGTFLYLEFIKDQEIKQKVKKVTLIEPSEISLKRAALHIKCISDETEIVTINKFLGDLNEYDIINPDRITLHIFSNIIDIKSIDLYQLSNYVKSKIQKESHFICVSPRSDNAGFTERINTFSSLLDGDCYYHIDFWRNDWAGDCHMSLRIIRVEDKNFSSNLHDNQSLIHNRLVNDLVFKELDSNMVTVNPGSFLMGATAEQDLDAWDNEYPVHQVNIKTPFKIAKYPVTQKLWYAIMGDNPSTFKHPDAPVTDVCWNDCIKFIEIINKTFELDLSLPSEAQWEFAARGGVLSRNYKYAGGNQLEEHAWYTKNTNLGPHTVGLKKPNELGIYDMNGNVWEWCEDWYYSYSSGIHEDPVFNKKTNQKVIRGGGWNSGKDYCRISSRQGLNPLISYNYVGFRLVEKI